MPLFPNSNNFCNFHFLNSCWGVVKHSFIHSFSQIIFTFIILLVMLLHVLKNKDANKYKCFLKFFFIHYMSLIIIKITIKNIMAYSCTPIG